MRGSTRTRGLPASSARLQASQASAISPSMLAVQPSSSEPPGSACSSARITRAPPAAAASAAASPGGPGADDEHVAMRKALRVAVRVRLRRRAPKARRAADQRLVERRPGRARPHEGLVVEARRKERRQEVARAPDVEAQGSASGSANAPRARRRARPASRARFGVSRAASRRTVTSAFGSSAPAVTMPRGRWYLNERPTRCTPFASSAEASVSPARPS